MENKKTTVSEIISKRYITTKHLNLTSRQVSYWKDKNILPFFEKSAHSKMNIPMATWLYVVRELSSLGINSKKLADLAKEVWEKPIQDDFFKTKVEKHLNSKAGQQLDEQERSIFSGLISSDTHLRTISQESNPFTDSIVDSVLIDRNHASLYYFPKSQEHHISVLHVKETTKLIVLMESEPFICIPLSPFLKSVVSLELKMIDKDLLYLSEVEKQIRDIVLFKEPKNIIVTLGDQKIDLSTTREQHKKAEQLAAFFLENKLPKNAKLIIEPRSQDNYKLTIITK